MKKLLLLISLFFALNLATPQLQAQNPKQSAGFTITLNAENAGKDWIYISRRVNGSFINIDSAKTTSFPVVLKGKQDVPEMLYLRIKGSNTLVPVFAENSAMKIYADFDDPAKSRVEGSVSHKEFDSYTQELQSISNAQLALNDEFKNAQKSGNKQKIDSLEIAYDKLDKAESDYNHTFVAQHKSSFVSPYVIRRAMFYTLELNELKDIVASLDKSVYNSVYTIDLLEKIAVLEKVAIGQKYTDIRLPGVDGQEMKLSDYVGNGIILVDFWASWCGPCRRENPNVVKLYSDFHDKGFDIVGVSFDNDEKGWKDAIKSDKLVWHQMSDLKGWGSKAAELYGVASIPHTVLIDKTGTIIAKNLRGDELRSRLSELLP